MGRPNHPYTVGGAYRSVPLRRGSMDFYEEGTYVYDIYAFPFLDFCLELTFKHLKNVLS